jgi:hypothetical protein
VPLAKVRVTDAQRGSWFASLNGEEMPCVHDFWTRRTPSRMDYADPGVNELQPQWAEFISALKAMKKVILTRDTTTDNGRTFKRRGYIAVMSIDDVEVINGALRFRFVDRLHECY